MKDKEVSMPLKYQNLYPPPITSRTVSVVIYVSVSVGPGNPECLTVTTVTTTAKSRGTLFEDR